MTDDTDKTGQTRWYQDIYVCTQANGHQSLCLEILYIEQPARNCKLQNGGLINLN